MRDELLSRLGLAPDNPGACAGGDWLQSTRRFTSEDPATASCIARVGEKDIWLAVCRDSEGNLLGLMSEQPAADQEDAQ